MNRADTHNTLEAHDNSGASENKKQPTVFLIDDDDAVRSSLTDLLESVRIDVANFGHAAEFLQQYAPAHPGCLLLDARLPGISGLELQERLNAQSMPPPIIFITGYADVPMAVQAMRNGAVGFLEKPVRQQVLLDSVFAALELDRVARQAQSAISVISERAAYLTPRERDVMQLVVLGLPNKGVAMRLGVTPKAIEAYRARVMRKMAAESLADLVRMSIVLEAAAGLDACRFNGSRHLGWQVFPGLLGLGTDGGLGASDVACHTALLAGLLNPHADSAQPGARRRKTSSTSFANT